MPAVRIMVENQPYASWSRIPVRSMHVPTAPRRGVEVFVNLTDYPHQEWRKNADHHKTQ